jgi:phage tail sheath gpL-like
MAKSFIVLTHNEGSADMTNFIAADNGSKQQTINKLRAYLDSLFCGVRQATMAINRSAVQATGTITFSGTGAANDTVLINGVTFTGKASGATGNEWNVGASATLSAAALADAINASASTIVTDNVTASAALGVITFTANRPGTLGNCVTIAEGVDGSSHMAVSGARLTGGTNGTQVSISLGQ